MSNNIQLNLLSLILDAILKFQILKKNVLGWTNMHILQRNFNCNLSLEVWQLRKGDYFYDFVLTNNMAIYCVRQFITLPGSFSKVLSLFSTSSISLIPCTGSIILFGPFRLYQLTKIWVGYEFQILWPRVSMKRYWLSKCASGTVKYR